MFGFKIDHSVFFQSLIARWNGFWQYCHV